MPYSILRSPRPLFRARAAAVFVAATVALGACHSHVALDPVAPTAAESERIAAYDRLRPIGHTETITVRSGTGAVVDRSADQLVLQNGQRVHYAEDLLPVVAPDSAAAQAATKAATWRKGKNVSLAIAVAATLLSTAVMFAALDVVSDDNSNSLDDSEPSLAPFYAGIAVAGVSSLAYMLFKRAENEEKAAAFMLYDKALRDRLALCVRKLEVVACDSADADSTAAR